MENKIEIKNTFLFFLYSLVTNDPLAGGWGPLLYTESVLKKKKQYMVMVDVKACCSKGQQTKGEILCKHFIPCCSCPSAL